MGKHGPAIVPAHFWDSLIIQYIRGQSELLRCPRPGRSPNPRSPRLRGLIDRMQPAAEKPKNAYAEWLLHKLTPAGGSAVHQAGLGQLIDAFVLAEEKA